jgi:hypothetical protein
MIVDADAHVVETEHTWDYLDASEEKSRPQLFQSADKTNAQYWLSTAIDRIPRPTLTEQELILSKSTAVNSRLRLRHVSSAMSNWV